ncbi:TonB-dependent receptor domain-containing protein [Mucilaginibacter glaciei]|uniref:TonB-dependent receptor n=1 Tax=Mucilaginibacter glaciei TaxID=2772109 RepID=A0A926NNM8_9SPHI|nr:TonB-dependent receptor [Mucilaginibacter glaciei]MBD1392553.1 TonB-dependent receptor [Mucilaginibacter glaciei]
MKIFLLTALACILSALSFAQTTPPTITVKGIVIDSAINKPMGYATIAITDAVTNAPVKSMLTKDDGVFEISKLPAKAYKLSVLFVGYRTKVLNISGNKAIEDVGTVNLSPSSKQLKEVSVVAARPLMKQEVDRISYDVLADPESKSLSALDMLRKVPLLSVDANDAIKLRGSGNYKILLNGKESALMARNPADILKAMPGTNIVKIEVITTPPAKYDAEGLAGIINIITSKNADQGYNGSVNAYYNTVFGYRTNLNLTLKQGKFGINAFGGVGNRRDVNTPFTNSTEFLKQPSTIMQSGSNYNGGSNNYVSTELSFEADTLNLLTGTFNYYKSNNTQGSNQLTMQVDNGIATNYNTTNIGSGGYNGGDFGLNYQHGFKRNKNQLLTASYKYSNNGNSTNNNVSPGNTTDYRQFNKAGSKEHTTQLDYVHPLKAITIEAGGKMINRANFSNFRNDILTASGEYVNDPTQTNDFDYKQDVYSLYNSYLLKLDKWTFKSGARFERTDIKANFSSTATNLDQGFNNLVPSVSIQRSLTGSTLTFGFTQRIQRPGIYQLNPFVNRSNPLYITVGNPSLVPAVNNNFELSYGRFTKGSFNLSSSYSFANNTIQNLASVNGNVTTTSFANVGKNKNLALDLNMTIPFTPKLNLNVNAEIQQVWLKGAFNGQFYSNSGQQGHVFTNASYKFDDGFRIGANIGFDSRYVLLQGTDNYYLGYGANVSKEMFGKKASISLYANGPFSKYIKLDFRTITDDFRTTTYNYQIFRTFGLSFNYKFGKLNSTIKKNQRGINNDDSSGGSRN